MNKHLYSLIVLLFVCICPALAQNTSTEEYGGLYPISRNDAAHPCITPEQYQLMEKQMNENLKLLKLDNVQHKPTSSTLFQWPLAPAAGLNDCSYYYIGNYVDEDVTSGIQDYNCGTVTYDAHRGTDICSAPYPFLKMDSNLLNVVAAAPGTIIQKSDGFFDKNCAANNDTANYIIIQHADGSVALYWHMKKFSLTSKAVGQTIVAGEFLGVVGSSGSASGPHLHFEVWSTTASSSLRDPWMGSCNLLNSTSWWVAQKPYTEPAIIKASINSALAVLPACPATETPNEDSCYAPGASAKMYIFLRNETIGDTAHLRIVNPDGSTYNGWTHNSINNYVASYWYYTKVLPTTPGTYTFETIYNGITCSKKFTIDCGFTGIATTNNMSDIQVSPNPASDKVSVTFNALSAGQYNIIVLDMLGRKISQETGIAKPGNNNCVINLHELPRGLYIISVQQADQIFKTKLLLE